MLSQKTISTSTLKYIQRKVKNIIFEHSLFAVHLQVVSKPFSKMLPMTNFGFIPWIFFFTFLKALICFPRKCFQRRRQSKSRVTFSFWPQSILKSCFLIYLRSQIYDLISFQYSQYGFPENIFNSVTQKFAKDQNFSFLNAHNICYSRQVSIKTIS